MKTIKELCTEYGLGQTELARRFNIPVRTIQNWHAGVRNPPDYVVSMMDELLSLEELRKPKKLNDEFEAEPGKIGGYCPNCGGTVLYHSSFLKKVKGHCCSWCGQAIKVE